MLSEYELPHPFCFFCGMAVWCRCVVVFFWSLGKLFFFFFLLFRHNTDMLTEWVSDLVWDIIFFANRRHFVVVQKVHEMVACSWSSLYAFVAQKFCLRIWLSLMHLRRGWLSNTESTMFHKLHKAMKKAKVPCLCIGHNVRRGVPFPFTLDGHAVSTHFAWHGEALMDKCRFEWARFWPGPSRAHYFHLILHVDSFWSVW